MLFFVEPLLDFSFLLLRTWPLMSVLSKLALSIDDNLLLLYLPEVPLPLELWFGIPELMLFEEFSVNLSQKE